MEVIVRPVGFDMRDQKLQTQLTHQIHHKGIVHNVLNDAPFIGALIIANSCGMTCTNCINESLKHHFEILIQSPDDIIQEIKENKLNEGIILSGLEWSEQPEEMVALVDVALKQQLKVMIYTHHDEDAFFNRVPQMKKKPVYIKFGLSDEHLQSEHHSSYSVRRATTNQYIKYFG